MVPMEGYVRYRLNNKFCVVRKRIRDTRMKVEEYQSGVRSNTTIQILYIEDLVHEELLEEVKNRLEEYKIDGILEQWNAGTAD